jgi:formamidopyrimidine-DNA glycosylase
MPELPEVENTVRGLKKAVVGSRIEDVWTDTPKLIRKGSFADLKKKIKGKKITDVSRRAKNIIISFEGGEVLLIHLKMTGHILIGEWNIVGPKNEERAEFTGKGYLSERINGYVRVIFYLDDGRQLALSDLRKFAKVVFGKKEDIMTDELGDIGVEALDMGIDELRKILANSSRSIKTLLMDQSKIAGIGNIYSDDILFKIGIHPLKKASSLSEKEIEKLYISIKEILSLAVKLGGTSISDYRDVKGRKGGYGERRLVYGKSGKPCSVCGTIIEKIKVGGRSASFCPKCQPLE